MDAYEVLVIILSVTLAIFLVLAITATIMLIAILKKLKAAAVSAQQFAENVETFSSSMLKASGPINFVRAILSTLNGKTR
ncbi:MAG: hypothetical protein WCP03_01690 [Candidatus Saccharibacteria bacterium]